MALNIELTLVIQNEGRPEMNAGSQSITTATATGHKEGDIDMQRNLTIQDDEKEGDVDVPGYVCYLKTHGVGATGYEPATAEMPKPCY